MNQHEEHIGEQEMKAAIERSGYLLEHRVEAILREFGYFVQMSQAYPDEMTGKSRELDIHAMQLRNCGPEDNDNLFPIILGECVNNSIPLVFFKSASEFLDDSEIKHSGLPTKIKEGATADESWTRLSEFLKLEEFHHFYTGSVSTQYCSFSKKRGSHEWMASHLDEHHDIFNTLTMAIESEINQLYRGLTIESPDDPIYLEFFYPLMILQGELWVAEFGSEELTMTQVNHVRYKRNHHSSERRGTYQIDVITESQLPGYLDMVWDETKKIAYRMKRNKVPIRTSIESLFCELSGFFDTRPVREILDYDSSDRIPVK